MDAIVSWIEGLYPLPSSLRPTEPMTPTVAAATRDATAGLLAGIRALYYDIPVDSLLAVEGRDLFRDCTNSSESGATEFLLFCNNRWRETTQTWGPALTKDAQPYLMDLLPSVVGLMPSARTRPTR